MASNKDLFKCLAIFALGLENLSFLQAESN